MTIRKRVEEDMKTTTQTKQEAEVENTTTRGIPEVYKCPLLPHSTSSKQLILLKSSHPYAPSPKLLTLPYPKAQKALAKDEVHPPHRRQPSGPQRRHLPPPSHPLNPRGDGAPDLQRTASANPPSAYTTTIKPALHAQQHQA